ncbi:glycoside hydrolase family 20 protein [Bacteroides helcogenes]|uniref:beta-N-acetylhexosaminidase n=1 Tax=Bacteroides helcogenes (strain ATCC 35417 / DSM 20613 / JCM 6297 / CCUG 15421 / P 36-108) TaxID=693979 RepID=E6SRS8_BACT6|nr:glycoside hydrolase family 20 protein [Bacteroides helcogenes]ADV42087.1 Beta-N-acetylhexosaminidase [Bacteroides helcogenes P 36-108]
MKRVYWLIVALFLFFSCRGEKIYSVENYSIIPIPDEVIPLQGEYILQGEKTVAVSSEEASMKVFHYLKDVLKNTSVTLKNVPQSGLADICFSIDNSLPDEAYILKVSPDGIKISSNSTATGLFYGVQSLLQLMPVDIYDPDRKYGGKIGIPAVSIKDAPRFSYRGAMMDVGRNFQPKEEVMKFLDLMAFYKLNKFHFHLTDDQGWRIEIKKYPKLTEIGSYRKQTQVGHSDFYYPRRFDGEAQRGYYTQEDIKEIVKYASERFITVIPEIEMPGHASAALAAYPELSCGLGKKYVVRDYFDVFDEVYCPKENTFIFLENVLKEVMELFPSHYIHIGGDECPKKAWKACTHCQMLMKQEGLSDETALQSWFIHRIERFVNDRGRSIIGWDEILEGGLAPNATVMSWRGEEGGIEAARQKHKVIMTPGGKCYFDHYQESPEFAPLAIGGFLPLDTVYAYNPLPVGLTPEEQSYIIGVQANVWGEYIRTPEYFEYMAFPRLLAMAEVQWTQPEKKDFKSFAHRLDKEFRRLDYYKINACRNFYEVNQTGAWNDSRQVYEVTLQTFCPDTEIHYAINDSTVTVESLIYKEPIRLGEDAIVYAAVYKAGKALGKVTCKGFVVNKATGCKYECNPEAGWEHLNKGFGLTDGRCGYAHDMRRWISFYQDSVQIVVEMKKPQYIQKVALSSLWRPLNAIWPIRAFSVSVSMDGKTFVPVGKKNPTYDFTLTEGTRFPVSLSFPEIQAVFVRLELLGGGLCPEGYYSEGQQSELAIDEVEIY